MPADPCKPIEDELAALRNTYQALDNRLNRSNPRLVGKQRGDLIGQMVQLDREIARKSQELQRCRRTTPAPPPPPPPAPTPTPPTPPPPHSGLQMEDCDPRTTLIIEEHIRLAVQNLHLITDVALRHCISERLNSTSAADPEIGDIECESICDTGLLGYNRYFLWWHSDTIHLCMTNIISQGRRNDLFKVILHEFAHSCGWDHGDGMGVPGNSGKI